MKNNIIIEPTLKKESIVIESMIPAACLSDISTKYEISEKSFLELLDKYFSQEELREIDNYIATVLDVDVVEESVDVSPDNLISKLPDNELKNMVKSAGVDLEGNESKDELKGMVKALANSNESVSKLKRKKVSKLVEESAMIVKEGGFSPEYIGGYKADVYVKLPEQVEIDAFADEIKSCLASGLTKGSVENVSITQLPKSVFESKKLSKFLKK